MLLVTKRMLAEKDKGPTMSSTFNADGIERIGEDFHLFLQAFWEESLFKSTVLENIILHLVSKNPGPAQTIDSLICNSSAVVWLLLFQIQLLLKPVFQYLDEKKMIQEQT